MHGRLASLSRRFSRAGGGCVGGAGQRMDNIVSQVKRVSQLIGEISEAAQQQTTGIAQVSDAVNQLDEVTQRNAALVEESAAAADSLKHQAIRLNAVVGRFMLSGQQGLATA